MIIRLSHFGGFPTIHKKLGCAFAFFAALTSPSSVLAITKNCLSVIAEKYPEIRSVSPSTRLRTKHDDILYFSRNTHIQGNGKKDDGWVKCIPQARHIGSRSSLVAYEDPIKCGNYLLVHDDEGE